MRARRAHDTRTHDANTAPHRHANIQYSNHRSTLFGLLPERTRGSRGVRAPGDVAGADAASQPPQTFAQKMSRNKTASGRVGFGVGNLGIRWSLSIVVQFAGNFWDLPIPTLSMRPISRAISVLFRPPRRRGAETTSRGPATARSNETAQPKPKVPNPMVSSHDAYLVAAITSEAAAMPPEAPQAAAASGTRGACQAAAGPAVIGGLRRPPLLRAPCARTAGPCESDVASPLSRWAPVPIRATERPRRATRSWVKPPLCPTPARCRSRPSKPAECYARRTDRRRTECDARAPQAQRPYFTANALSLARRHGDSKTSLEWHVAVSQIPSHKTAVFLRGGFLRAVSCGVTAEDTGGS